MAVENTMEREVRRHPREARSAAALNHPNVARTARARTAHARRFLELWDGCDPELQPMYQEGEALLTRLQD